MASDCTVRRPTTKDLTGQVFGKRTVLGFVKYGHGGYIQIWKVRCECGREGEAQASSLRGGKQQQCTGCQADARRINLAGQVFGKWTVLRLAERGDKKGDGAYWLCRCECGLEVVIHGLSLRHDHTHQCRSCNDKLRTLEESPVNYLIRIYNHNARARDREFALSRERCVELFFSCCHYCGIGPSTVFEYRKDAKNKATEHPPIMYNGIDRVDSDLGYIEGNVVPCCSVCNMAKNDTPVGDFLGWARRLVMFQDGKVPSGV
jgi:hypothetical protein